MSSASVSPTAHYTGHIWARNRMSHPALETPEGKLLFAAVEPAMFVSHALTGDTLEVFLLARHREIDARLQAAIEAGRVTQVVEIAAGLSPRGWRFAERYGDAITYVETDLPGMAERKREALQRMGSLGEHHRVEELDALSEDGLSELAAGLDPSGGLAVITEGLLSYLSFEAVAGLWRRIATTLGGFSDGIYLADLHLRDESGGLAGLLFVPLLSAFVRGRVGVHFADEREAIDALRRAGFADAELHHPSHLVRVIEATSAGRATRGSRGSRSPAG